MEWIVIIGLSVALYQLWRRVEHLENRLANGESFAVAPVVEIPELELEQVSPAAQPVAPPVPASASMPQVARTVARVVGAVKPVRAPHPDTAPRKTGLAINFEDLFGRQLPIWAGGITLAIAGFFLVMYAIDLGLLSPLVRVLLGFVFGGLLITGAFVVEQMRERVDDPRVPQALAGAGIATLYACFYLAGQGYGLIGSGATFLGLAGVTAGAIWLSFRFGLPCAVLGLVGGFAAPTLVASDEANLPVLSVYLALVSAGLTLTGNRQNRSWLGIAALGGGLLWGMAMLLSPELDFVDQAFVGLYLVGIGVVLPAGLGDVPGRRWFRAGAGAFAALQMAALIDNGGFSLLTWGLYGLLSAALAVLAWRERDMRDASALTAAVALWMLVFWPNPTDIEFALVATGLTAISALVPLFHVWRDDGQASDVVQIAGFAAGLAIAVTWHFGAMFNRTEIVVAAVAFSLAVLPALATWRIGEGQGWRGHLLEASAAVTTFFAYAQLLHDNWGAIACALSAVALALTLARRISAARTFAAIAAVFAIYPLAEWIEAGWVALVGEPMRLSDLATWQDTARYLVPGVIAGLVLAWRQVGIGSARITQAICAIAGVGALIAVHSFYREIFAIDGLAGFTRFGLAERTLWEAFLIAAAFVAWQMRSQVRQGHAIALGLCFIALAHFGWFTLLLHNPLWSAQAVGPVPVANLALAAYAVAIAGILLLRELGPAKLRLGIEVGVMALIPLLVLTLLRQGFSGSILTDVPLNQTEDLLRSLAGIVLAIGYLLWGARREDRTWRIGSLVLMLMAVGKVFLVDAAGLTGLARIASFMTLGFSLIGIGWFYTRILSRPAAAPSGQPTG